MVVLLWLIRIYKWWIIAWVLMSWVPGLGGSDIHVLLGLPVYPVIAPFSFLSLGPLSIAPLIPLLILGFAESWLSRATGETADETDVQAPPPQEVIVQPVGAEDTRRWEERV